MQAAITANKRPYPGLLPLYLSSKNLLRPLLGGKFKFLICPLFGQKKGISVFEGRGPPNTERNIDTYLLLLLLLVLFPLSTDLSLFGRGGSP
jgi:hypothetical protein